MPMNKPVVLAAFLIISLPIVSPCAVGAEPKAIDQSKVAITLERSACFGPCPVYKVTIHGDGRVIFTTATEPVDQVDEVHRRFAQSDGVLLPGTYEDRISAADVAALVEKFQAARFWKLRNAYRTPVTDSPTYVVTFDTGKSRKTVIDYVGGQSGMPHSVTELEEAVDRVAGTDRWVRGTPGLLPWLERTGFDFHSGKAAELAVSAAFGEGAEETVVGLIDRGVPLDGNAVASGSWSASAIVPAKSAGILITESSIKRGQAKLFGRMAAAGWLQRMGKGNAAQAFAQYAAGCSPQLVDAVADAGIDIDAGGQRNADNSPDSPQAKTALAELAGSYACEGREADRVKTAERLLARGANPNSRDSVGRTPLYGVESLDLLNFLLQHGADATAKSKDGQSMLFGSWTDAIVLRLLEAGASPAGHYDVDGVRTLAEQAKYRKMPLVAKWLIAHPEAYRR
jgi:Domain of unknown function (DUF6438)